MPSKLKLYRESENTLLFSEGKRFVRIYRENGELYACNFWNGSFDSYCNYLKARGQKLPTEIYVSAFTPLSTRPDTLKRYINEKNLLPNDWTNGHT